MFKYIIPLNRNSIIFFRFTSNQIRFYRTKYRKKVSIELNKPSIYDEKRNAPSKLLKANLFTPESAGPRELPMLCYWIVNYGYADSSILTRYVQCAIDNIKKLKVKSISLIFHSVSKYLHNNKISLVEPQQIDESNQEFENRDVLVRKCIEMIVESSSLLPNMFVNAVPKDLGMIALSVVSVYEIYLNECNIDLTKDPLKETKSYGKNTKTVGSVINKLLQRLSQEIIPKLPFCNIEEFSAFAKAFSKINSDWSNLFMRELSLEVSSLLMDKIEDLELLSQNKFIGEDLIDDLNRLPRELSTITCSLSKCKINERKFWERSLRVISHFLDLKDRNFGIKDIDLTTLTLLCTSMSNYVDVRRLVEEILEVTNESDQYPSLVGFNIAIRNLKDESLAERFLNNINFTSILDINPRLLSQFIFNFSRSGLAHKNEVIEKILDLLHKDLDIEVLSSIFVSSKRLDVPYHVRMELCDKLSRNVGNLETMLLVSILINSTDLLSDEKTNNLFKELLDVLENRVDQIQLTHLPYVLSLVVNTFPGNLTFIGRACRKIDENFSQFNIYEIASLYDRVCSMGLNVNKLFSKNIGKIREFNRIAPTAETPYSFDPQGTDDTYDIDFDNNELNVDFNSPIPTSGNKFSSKDESEISQIAKYTLTKSNNIKVLRTEDFRDESPEQETVNFELRKFPTDSTEYGSDENDSGRVVLKAPMPKAVARGSTVDDLKNEWSQLRQNVQ